MDNYNQQPGEADTSDNQPRPSELRARSTIEEVRGIAEEARERFRFIEEALDESVRGRRAALDREMADLAGESEERRFNERVYSRAREIIQEAYESSSEVRLDALRRTEVQIEHAERLAGEVIERARIEAETLRTQAALETKLALQRAEREAEAIVAEAKEQYGRVLAAATADADRLREEAEREVAALKADAQTSLEEAHQRGRETARLEEEFDRTAREFARWLGLETKPKQKLFSRVLHRSRE